MKYEPTKTEITIHSFDGSYNIKVTINESANNESINNSIIRAINHLITGLDFKRDISKEGFDIGEKAAISILDSVAEMLKSNGFSYGEEENLALIKSLIAFTEYKRGDNNAN
ncbi:hypothetical protein [Paenibacillus glycanilyticus]|uniref:Uncharacterized protein n=1 Tax=Paenibacillus glycanilyticus TaxID=126569 RepID=A0ABQ6GDZ5_9BACL|nr:hypothetical protein [Paenibacillus glycanilyticus]GLX68320.1 hypothetical protein MU1_26650 [Paenibacillus glycanilyticus]